MADTTSTEAAERARVLARADSIRDAMDRPPGERRGLSTLDVVRLPFDAVAGAAALGWAAFDGTMRLVRELDVLREIFLSDDPAGLFALTGRVDAIGSRSLPAAILAWEAAPPFFLRGGYSIREYELLEGGLRFGDAAGGVEIGARHRFLRQPHFWGVGPDSRERDRSDYARQITSAGVRGWSHLGTPVRFRAELGWERSDVGRGFEDDRTDLQDVFDPDGLFGAASDVEYVRWGVGAMWENVSRPKERLRGVRVEGSYEGFAGVGGTPSDFHRLRGDLRGYLPVVSDNGLAFRLLLEDHVGEEDRGVPFFHLASLGDEHGLRGHPSRRFRDRTLVALQSEWRYKVWFHPGENRMRGDAFLFLDAGTVGPSLGRIRARDLDFDPGFGLRLRSETGTLGSGWVGFGDEGAQVGVSVGFVF